MNTSGWTWSDTTGVTMSPATQGAWDDFVKQYPDAEQFENKGWPFHELMVPVMPNKAKGGHVFQPASVAARSSSPDWDESRFNQPEDDDHLAGSMNGAGEGSEDFRGNAGSAGDDDEEEEEEEDKGDDSDSSPAPSKQSGKRRAAQPAPAQSIQKKPRLTPAAQGLLSLTKSAERFNEIFGDLRDFPGCSCICTGSSEFFCGNIDLHCHGSLDLHCYYDSCFPNKPPAPSFSCTPGPGCRDLA
ncbi:Myb-DNA-bind-3 domain-containing protein [Mycena venus]|uniref:Myb-DNA-bind-3 domain-containing protein n=1 Tax=Mycena venus TaxID=2733690 RepID=A0A8H7DBW1_9AGAR|nr:Myb-DNA-bind-3 domain-containing protein [Mycena venus]